MDGRPTTLTLDQIPADAIESVEVITNPSAKFDASGGGAGILNIVLKKNRKTGYNGNLRAGVDKYGAINGGGDFSIRQGKFNVTASAMINQMNGKTNGVTDRLNLTDTPETSLHQTDYDRNKGEFIFARFGIDYLASNRNTFSLTAFRVHGEINELLSLILPQIVYTILVKQLILPSVFPLLTGCLTDRACSLGLSIFSPNKEKSGLSTGIFLRAKTAIMLYILPTTMKMALAASLLQRDYNKSLAMEAIRILSSRQTM